MLALSLNTKFVHFLRKKTTKEIRQGQHPISPSNNKTTQFIMQSNQKKKSTSVEHIPLSKAETIAGIRRNTFPHPI